MKNLLLILFPTFLFFACNTPTASSSTDAKQTSENEGKNKVTSKTFKVSGRLMQTAAYCGGAAPSEEILAELAKPKPLGSFQMHVRPGKTNDRAAKLFRGAITDAAGRFEFELPAGEWCIITHLKAQPGMVMATENTIVDEKCIEKWGATCDAAIVVVDQDIVLEDIVLYKACFVEFQPCTQWTGPLPASAPPRDH